ncbi:hypothetical protein CFT12S02847_08350 [Campylobacter fetus subsp. testudinum]|uniref:hypothetical protein n=1 Tax=Campylobacter fetus TaxID=196 RepID=UPI000818C489|nr:hypothetical protein [Campylobacter fetus]OCR95503.1 hypothetical protein CFT12S02847_08350 [Campylobacter fetus subsp. testudinum]
MARPYQNTAYDLLEAVGFASIFLKGFDKTKNVLEDIKIDHLKLSDDLKDNSDHFSLDLDETLDRTLNKISNTILYVIREQILYEMPLSKTSPIILNKRIEKTANEKLKGIFSDISNHKLFKGDSKELNLCRVCVALSLKQIIIMAIAELNELYEVDTTPKAVAGAIDTLKTYVSNQRDAIANLDYSDQDDKPNTEPLDNLFRALYEFDNFYFPRNCYSEQIINKRATKAGKRYLLADDIKGMIREYLNDLQFFVNLKVKSIINKNSLITAIETDYNLQRNFIKITSKLFV